MNLAWCIEKSRLTSSGRSVENLSIRSCSSEAEPASFLKMSYYRMLVSRTHLVTHTDIQQSEQLSQLSEAASLDCSYPFEKYCHGSKLVRYSEKGMHWRRRGPTGISKTTDSLPHSVSPGLGVTASPSSPPCVSFLGVAICSQPSHLG